MISVGGIQLHRGVYWANEHSEPLVSEEVFPDYNGGLIIQRFPLSGGRQVILEAQGSDSGGTGFFTKAFIDQIELWEVSGEQLTIIYGSKTLNVVVPKSPLSVTPLRKMYGHVDDDIYYGSITFLEVTQ